MSNRWQNTIPRPQSVREAERVVTNAHAVTPERAEELKAAWREFARRWSASAHAIRWREYDDWTRGRR